MKGKYLKGGMGYGDAKKQLLDMILSKFRKEREKFNYYCSNPEEVNIALSEGAIKARKVSKEVLLRVRKNTGY
jgi:Tryptophanyl-tRNA synthetase